MTKTILSILFVAAILMTAVIASSIDLVQFAEGTKAKGKYIKQYGPSTKNIVCGDRLCSETGGVKKMPSPPEEVTEEAMEEKMKPTMEKVAHKWKTASETIKSTQDPGIGHESHQIAIILPPTDKGCIFLYFLFPLQIEQDQSKMQLQLSLVLLPQIKLKVWFLSLEIRSFCST